MTSPAEQVPGDSAAWFGDVDFAGEVPEDQASSGAVPGSGETEEVVGDHPEERLEHPDEEWF
jgi:hypothetical protein